MQEVVDARLSFMFLILGGLAVCAIVLLILSVFVRRAGPNPQQRAEEAARMQEMHQAAEKIDKRVQAIEDTLLKERRKES